MKKLFVLLLSLFLLAGCICGCSEEPENTTPDITQATEENAPAESAPEESQAATPSATAPPATLPPGAPKPVEPQPTTSPAATPEATVPGATTPLETEPVETKPQNATVPPFGAYIENLTCTYSIGNGSQKTIQNPTASHLYQFIRQARSKAEKRNPSGNENAEVIHFSFKIGEKEISWLDIYADDYAAIPLTVELPATQFYLFPSGTYQTILNTLNSL